MSGESCIKYCQHCNKVLSEPVAWKFCSDECWDAARKVSKSLSNQRYHKLLKEEGFEASLEQHRKANKLSRSQSYYKLTEPKLLPLFERAATPQEEFTHRDDFFEDIARKIIGITLKISHPLADLPVVAATARDKLSGLLTSLDERERDFGTESTIAQLRLAILAIERDIGRKNTAKALGHISRLAKKVQQQMHAHKELYGFIHALLVRVEIFRIRYFATSDHQFLDEARTWLKDAEGVCDRALERLPRERKQLAGFLRCYVDLVMVRLAFDSKELNHIDTLIEAAYKRVTKFAQTAAPAPLIATVRFQSVMNYAERQLLLPEPEYDRSSEYVAKAEHILPNQYRSIESQHRIAITKTGIALARQRTGDEKCVDDYLSLLDRNPCPEYRYGLQELKNHYGNEVPDVELLTRRDNSLHVDTAFTQVLPFVTPIGALKGVWEEAIQREEESEVMLPA
jgi:hypothetical protein